MIFCSAKDTSLQVIPKSSAVKLTKVNEFLSLRKVGNLGKHFKQYSNFIEI